MMLKERYDVPWRSTEEGMEQFGGRCMERRKTCTGREVCLFWSPLESALGQYFAFFAMVFSFDGSH
jgi:hypothetical protein